MILSTVTTHAVFLVSLSNSRAMSISPDAINAMDNGIRDDLQAFSQSLFAGVVWSAIVVVIGVAMEGPEILHELWPRTFTFFATGSLGRIRRVGRWLKLIGFVGWMLVVVGVAGEGIFEMLQNRAEGQLQTFNDILLADAQRNAGSARSSAVEAANAASRADSESDKATQASASAMALAGGLTDKITSANEKAADAVSRLAGAEQQLADATRREASAEEKLRWLKTPRTLRNASALSSLLKQFEGTEYSFPTCFAEDESISLLKQIDAALHAAGWKRVAPSPVPMISMNVFGDKPDERVGLGTLTGVEIEVDSTESTDSLNSKPSTEWPKPVQVGGFLKNALSASIDPPSDSNVLKDLVVTNGSSAVVRILVGKKP